MMYLIGSAAVNIERDAKILKRFFNDSVVFVNHLLRSNSFLAGFYGDGYPVFVGTTDKYHILTFGAEVADVNVGRHINTGKMTDVYGAIGIWKSRSYSIAFERFGGSV
jgi:hypothetical protein